VNFGPEILDSVYRSSGAINAGYVYCHSHSPQISDIFITCSVSKWRINMMKLKPNIRRVIAGLFAVVTAYVAVPNLASAQDAVPQSPPELRDFKLDPEKPKPAPKPLPQDNEPAAPPVQNAPPARTAPAPVQVPAPRPRPSITLPDTAIAPPRRNEAAPQRRAPDTQRTLAPTAPVAASGAASSVPEASAQNDAAVSATPPPATPSLSEPVTQAEPTASAPASNAAAPEDSTPKTQGSGLSAHWIWLAIGIATMLGAFVLFLRRQKSGNQAQDEITLEAADDTPAPLAPSIAAKDEPVFTDDTALQTIPAPDPISAPIQTPLDESAPVRKTKRPELEISFIPEKATLSLARLTIKGQIRIINAGNAAVKSMNLRAAIICANAQQDEQISAFHSYTDAPGDEIGAATIGERIAMDIDLIIPLSELSSFPVGDKQLFAPIVVVHIDYAWGSGAAVKKDIAKLSCVVGREADPPKPKMAPLRLDLGPRSFTPLGQRPVFA
jgi:hypothetical protein